MLKSELRQRICQIKRQFTPQQLEELSLPVLARLKERLKAAQTIVAYYSLPDEVNTHDLIDSMVEEGKTVFLPKVVDTETMVLCRYTGRGSLREGAFGIMEPVGEVFSDYSEVDVVLVPGIAFDADGHRLGRGRGYYDRFLRNMRTIGVCFDFQIVQEVPVDVYDVKVDEVI